MVSLGPSPARLAAALERLVRDARSPHSLTLSAAAPFRASAVRDAAPELLALAATLRRARRPSADGLARARRLLTDPAGPVYGDTGESLRKITHDIRTAVEDSRN